MSTQAFIVIDVQNDFCEGGALAVPGGVEIIPVINNMISEDVSACVISRLTAMCAHSRRRATRDDPS
ncbi:MAG: nicotinamidase, partial [Pseudomonadota bacterium]